MQRLNGEYPMGLENQIDLNAPVLVVEDEVYVAAELESVLGDLGFAKVEISTSMEDAETRLQKGEFGVVIADIKLKSVLSFPLIAHAVKSGLAVVTISGYLSDVGDLSDTVFLPKPIRPGALSAAIILASSNAKRRANLKPDNSPDAQPIAHYIEA
jgi:DNA-binding NtrC family response regulator